MKTAILAAMALALLPGFAAASDICDDLWFTRNAVVDRGGYCFSTPLGEAVFDNSDCISTTPELGPQDRDFVSRIVEEEARQDCAVDTARRSLDVPDLALRRRLLDLPFRDETESACLGWRGGRTFLYAGTGEVSRVLGSVEPGDVVTASHQSLTAADGRVWSYYTVRTRGGGASPIVAGWSAEDLFADCSQIAG